MKNKSVGANFVRPEKGITLIALVITIIIMLILVAVTVIYSIGEKNLFSKTIAGKKKEEKEQYKEKIGEVYLTKKIDAESKETNSNWFENMEIEIENIEVQNISKNAKKITTIEGYEFTLLEDGTIKENVSLLEKGIKKVEYIESAEEQYIDTKINVTDKTKVVAEMEILSDDGKARYLFGSVNPESTCFAVYKNMKNKWAYQFGDGTYHNISTQINYDKNKHKFELDAKNKTLIIDDGDIVNIVSNYTITKASQVSMYIFALNYVDDIQGSKSRLYSFKIYEDENLVRDFIPCYRIENKEVGLYDMVNEEFYGNKGKDCFTCPEI